MIRSAVVSARLSVCTEPSSNENNICSRSPNRLSMGRAGSTVRSSGLVPGYGVLLGGNHKGQRVAGAVVDITHFLQLSLIATPQTANAEWLHHTRVTRLQIDVFATAVWSRNLFD
jgi:hypothetical protein